MTWKLRSMPQTLAEPRRGLFAVVLAVAAACGLAGCAIGLPIQMAPAQPADRPEDRLQVSLTHAVLDADRREPFDRYTQRIVKALPAQPGLVAFSVRRQLFGPEVWTITAWESEADRQRFFTSGLHLEAMRTAGAAITELKTKRLELRRDELPKDWRAVIELWGAPEAAPGASVR